MFNLSPEIILNILLHKELIRSDNYSYYVTNGSLSFIFPYNIGTRNQHVFIRGTQSRGDFYIKMFPSKLLFI